MRLSLNDAVLRVNVLPGVVATIENGGPMAAVFPRAIAPHTNLQIADLTIAGYDNIVALHATALFIANLACFGLLGIDIM
jgi:hypothetical protein